MRVLQINNQWRLGGAEAVMHQLHEGLLREGHDSRICVAEGKRYPPGALPLYPRWLSRMDHSRLHEFTRRYFPREKWTDAAFARLAGNGADLLHLHNFHGNYATIRSLAQVAARKKLLWTFHALWGVTGGCDHPRDCLRYQEKCGACPQIGRWPLGPVDNTAAQLREKLDLLAALPLHIVAPSRWLAEIVRTSQVGRGWKIHTIPNGVDPAQFAPTHQRATDRVTILVVNRNFQDEQKGGAMVKQALSMIDPAGIRLLLAGGGSGEAAAEYSQRFECRDAGYVSERSALARLYAEADVFLFASPAENFPCVILEAMASTCCVVATPTGGVVEQIEDRRSGLLASAISGEALGVALREALADWALMRETGAAARERVIREFSADRMLRRYLELYREVLDEN